MIRHSFYTICFALIFLSNSCTLPSDPEPIKWKFSAVIPLAKELVDLWTPLDSIVDDMSEDSDTGSSVELTGDSVITMIRYDTVITTMDMSGYFKESTESEVERVGEVVVEGLDTVVVPLPAIPGETIESDNQQCQFVIPIESDQFELIRCSDTSPALIFTVVNNGPVAIESYTVRIDKGSAITSTEEIAPDQTVTVEYPMNGVELNAGVSSITIQYRWIAPVLPGTASSLSFSFNGQLISSGVLQDLLFPDTIELDVEKELADSIKIDHCLLNTLTMNTHISNGLSLPANLNASLFDGTSYLPMWESPLYLLPGELDTVAEFHDLEMTPRWDCVEQKVLMDLKLQLTPHKTGDMVAFNADDSVAIVFTMNSTSFASVTGEFVNDLTEEERASDWELPELVADDIRDSVIGKLKTEGAEVSAQFYSRFDTVTVVDSVELQVVTNYSHSNSGEEQSFANYNFSQMQGGVEHQVQFDGDTLISYLPEKLASEAVVTVPAGTPFHIVPEGDSLQIPFEIQFKITLPLHFVTTAPVSVVTDVEMIELPHDNLQVLKTLEETTVRMNFTYKNLTEMDMELFAMMTGEGNFELIDTISSTRFHPDNIGDLDSVFFHLTGGQFLKIRPGEGDTTLQWTITNDAVEVLADNDTIYMKFRVELPGDADMPLDTAAALQIKSSIAIEGLAHSDFMKEFE